MNARRRGASGERGLRVTGGTHAGRRMRAGSGPLRPSADRVRESLFARLGDLGGVAALDLYAGCGALGIEALSRGAESLVAVERAQASLRALRANLETLGLSDRARVLAADAVAALRRLGGEGARFGLVLIDPPYASGEALRAQEALVSGGVLEADAVVVLERGWRHPVPVARGLALVDERRYGETVIARLVPARPEAPGDA